jgi:1,4-dihydroxy-2-naphthoyl-CoA hydrolase
MSKVAAALLGGVTDGFNTVLGTEYVELTADLVVLRCPVTPELMQPHGIVHGGVYCSLGETAVSIGGSIWLGDRGRVVGVANHTNFLRATREGVLHARATPVHRGRSQQLWRHEVADEAGKLVAVGEVRLANLDPVAGS